MKYQWLLSVCIIFCGFTQASAQWKKISVPNHPDSTKYLTAQKSDDEVVLLTKSQKIYLYKSSEGIHYKGDSDIRLGRFLARREIAEIYPDGDNLWYQMYQRRFLSRGHYDAVYFFDVDSDKAVNAQTTDSLFENVERITGSFYSEAKDILVFSTRCSGLTVRSNNRFHKRVSYNSSLMDNCLNALAVDEQGHIWLASQTAGLLEYNLRKDSCRSFNIDNSVLTSNRIRNVKTGGKGAVYFNDYSGNLYTIKNDSAVNLTEHIGAYEDPQLEHFSPDRQGGLWLYFTPDSMFRIAHLDRDSRLTELPSEDYPFEPAQYSVSAMYALRDELLLFTSSGIYSYRFRE
jgi:hypothetical protein